MPGRPACPCNLTTTEIAPSNSTKKESVSGTSVRMDSPRLTYRSGAALYTPTSSLSDQPSTTGGLDGPVTEGFDDDVSGAVLGATATAALEGTAAVGFGAGVGAGAGFCTALRDLNHLITISIHTSY